MCLAFPMRVERVRGPAADVRAGEVRATVGIQLLERVRKGDYVLVHAGLAIEKVDEARAGEIWRLIADLGRKVDEAGRRP
jgi:hydrogenase expression/formation protein HypC